MRPRATTHRERIEMIQQHQAGDSFRQIAEQMGLHRDTVRSWWRVWQREGWAGLKPKDRHRPGRGPLSSFDPLVRYGALRLKREHPHWGPDTLLLNLSRRPSLAGKALPSRSALAAYLQPYLLRIRPSTDRLRQVQSDG